IENALGQPPEETRHAVLEHLTAWAQHAGTGEQHVGERHEIVLVAASTVQHEKDGTAGFCRRFVRVDEIHSLIVYSVVRNGRIVRMVGFVLDCSTRSTSDRSVRSDRGAAFQTSTAETLRRTL